MLVLGIVAAISYTLHVKDVFQPPKPPALELWSEKIAVQRDPVEFQTKEGARLRGWLYKAERPDAPYVLFFYGANEDIAHEAVRLAWLRDTLHVNALCFDYPGYGFSTGTIDADAIRSASLQEFDYVRDHLAPAPTPIVAYGWSIGTALAIHVAAQRTATGLILQAPPASSDEMTKTSSHHDVPWYGRGIVKIKADPSVRQLYEGAKAIAGVNTPLLVIQGQEDDVVPLEQGREVFQASPAKQKQFVEVPGAHHNDLHFTQPPASTAVGDFLTILRSASDLSG